MQGGNLERNEGRHVMAVSWNAFFADWSSRDTTSLSTFSENVTLLTCYLKWLDWHCFVFLSSGQRDCSSQEGSRKESRESDWQLKEKVGEGHLRLMTSTIYRQLDRKYSYRTRSRNRACAARGSVCNCRTEPALSARTADLSTWCSRFQILLPPFLDVST